MSAAATASAAGAVRDAAGGAGADRYLAPELPAAVELVATGGLVAAARAVTGALE